MKSYDAEVVGVQGTRVTRIKISGRSRKSVPEESVTISENICAHLHNACAKRMDEMIAEMIKNCK